MIEPVKPPLDVDALARRLPRRGLAGERAQAMRHALLEAADQPAPRPWLRGHARGLAGGGALAAALCGAIAWRAVDRAAPGPAPAVAEIVVSDAPGAPARPPGAEPAPPATADRPLPEGAHAVRATRPTQIVHAGVTITAPAGAQFDVDVRGGEVQHLTVRSGWVVIAAAHSASTMIVERQTWDLAPPPASPAAPPTAPPPPAGSTVATPPPTLPTGPDAVRAPAIATPVAPDAVPAPPASSVARAPSRVPHASAPPTSPDTRAPSPATRASATTPRAPTEAPPTALPSGLAAAPANELATASASGPVTASPSEPATASASGSAASAPAAAPAPASRALASERDFRDGLRTLLAGDAAAARGPLDRACAAPSSAQADVCYWAAIAWLRAGDRAHARRSLEELLIRFPGATHAAEASVALGWLVLERGDKAGARARFAAAAAAPLPEVRADAARGLAAAR
jgi:regulator of sigma E protease